MAVTQLRGNRLPIALKLTAKQHYSRVMQGGAKRFSSTTFLLLAKKNQQNHPRLGIIIGKKACAKATQRNRIKRVIRESFRCTSLPHADVVILMKTGVSLPTNQQLFRELEYLWRSLSKKFDGPS